MMKTVQVVMSTYNGEKYIREQIDSIITQKGVKVRLLVRDDGSKDATRNILREYEDHDKLKLICGDNIGYIKSFLTLLDVCDAADYYAFSDQDDVWLDDKLISGVEKLEREDNDIPLLYSSALQRVDESLKYRNIQSFPGLVLNLYSALVRERLAGCTFLMNNNLHNYVKGSSLLNINYAHDSWTVLLCWAMGGKVVFDDTPHILFRRDGTNTSVDGGGLKKRIKHEFRYLNKCKNQRYDTVKLLLKLNSQDISDENKEFLEKIANYKDSIWKTIMLSIDKRLDCGIKASNLLTRFIILVRCF